MIYKEKFNPSPVDSWSISIWFFSRSFITTCINIRLGLKWKWSANFSIQAREDRQQIKQKRNHPKKQPKEPAKETKTHLKLITLQKLLLSPCVPCRPCWEATSEEQSAGLGTLVTGRAEWGGSGWAVANLPLQRGVQQMHGSHSLWAWYCYPSPEAFILQVAVLPKLPCTPGAQQNEKKQLVRKEVQGKCWFSLASFAMSMQRAWAAVYLLQAVQSPWKSAKKGCESVFGVLVGLQRTQHDVPAWDALLPCWASVFPLGRFLLGCIPWVRGGCRRCLGSLYGKKCSLWMRTGKILAYLFGSKT